MQTSNRFESGTTMIGQITQLVCVQNHRILGTGFFAPEGPAPSVQL